MKILNGMSRNFRKIVLCSALAGTAAFMACGDVNLQGQIPQSPDVDSSGITADGTLIQDVASCNMVEVAEGFSIVCDGSLVGTLRHGADGKDGEGCELVELDGGVGYQVTCGETTGIISNSSNTEAGCEVAPAPDSSGVYVVCGNKALLVRHGKDGVSVMDTLVFKDTLILNAKDTLYISSKDTVVVSRKDTLVTKDTMVVATGCGIVSASEGSVTIACGKDTSVVKANVTINNTYNNGTLESTTFDPIIVYVSSSSAKSSSSMAEVVVKSSSSLSYNVDLNVTTRYVNPIGDPTNNCSGCGRTIYRGDSTAWKIYTANTSTVTDILASTYEWKFPGAKNIEYYAGVGNDGLVTPYIVYDSLGTFKAQYSINGSVYKNSGYSVTVKPSLIRNCACREDETYGEKDPDTTKWVLSGCNSYAPITKYEWEGVAFTGHDGLEGYTPKNYNGQTKVSVSNSDGTQKEVACGYVLDNTTGFTFSTPGTYYLTYACNEIGKSSVRFYSTNAGAEGVFNTSQYSATVYANGVNNSSYSYGYSSMFGSNSNEEASGSPIVFTLKSGTFKVHCY